MTDFRGLPPVRMPDGYELRAYRGGDEAAWVEVVNSVGFGPFTLEKAREGLFLSPRFMPEGHFFAVHDGVAVSTATAFLDAPGNLEIGQLHMVATKPEHQGQGLARECSLAVVHFFAERGFGEVYLWTDDWRLPALKMYLRMGFKPVYLEGSGEDRWREVFRKLGLAWPPAV